MRHRGPDDDGLVSHGDATIGMRRLAIFDPAHGHQPMVTDDGRFHLVFNGAIYNFRALRDELAAGGWVFRTQCDTEVLLAAYARWGEACLPRLRGMFAVAVWDCAEQSLFLARDPLGIKPLYVREDGGRLLFASELNALLASGLAAGEIDPVAVADYLAWFAVPAPRTIYRGIRSLLPGECARFRAGRLEPRTFWNFAAVPRDLPVAGSRPEFIRALRHQLDDTIRAHVVADVPVGAFLSGGLDSAAVVGLMSRAGGAPLRIMTRVNGEVMQDSNTDDLIFDVPTLVHELSKVMTLDPGDIIITGTPSGVAMARKPQPWLKPGDVCEVEIEKIGILRNPIAQGK